MMMPNDSAEVWRMKSDHLEPKYASERGYMRLQYYVEKQFEKPKSDDDPRGVTSGWFYFPAVQRENEWVHPYPNGLPEIKDINFSEYAPWQDHHSEFAIVVGDGQIENYSVDWYYRNVESYEYDEDYDCENCWDGDCDNCNHETGGGIFKTEFPALRGVDPSCWGNAMPIVRAVQNECGTPTHMVLLFDSDSLWGRKNTYEDIMKFYGYMQEAGVIPKGNKVKLLSKDDVNENATVWFSDISKMSPEKMYFIFCTMRTPVQHPGIVRLTNRLIEEKNMDYLYAFIMAQVLHPCFQSGHSVVNPNKLRFVPGISWSDRINNKITTPALPKLDRLLEYSLRTVKLLKHDLGPLERIDNTTRDYWSLDHTLIPTTPTKEIHPLKIRYSKNLRLTPDNLFYFKPQERRFVQ
jgi:hypothetical protein